MNEIGTTARKGFRIISLSAVTLALLASFQAGSIDAQAQAAPTLVFSTDPVEAAEPLAKLILRPNVEQPIYLYVKNPGEEARKLTLVVQGADKAELVRAEVTAPAGKVERIKLPKPAPPAEKKPAAPVDPKAPPVEAKKPAWPELSGPPFVLTFTLLDDKNKVVEKRNEQVTILAPSQYLDTSASYGNGKLTVTVTALNTFSGPPCPVDLVLQSKAVASKEKEAPPKDGNLHETLKKAGQSKKLVANLAQDAVGRAGTVFLSIDGYQRAFVFPAEFNQRATATAFDPFKDPAWRIPNAEPVGKNSFRMFTAPTEHYPLRLETDNIPLDTRIEVGMDRDLDGNFDETELKILPGSRQRKVFFNPDMPDGGLLFRTEVSDWVAELDIAGLVGNHPLRIRLLDNGDADLSRQGVLVIDPTPPEKITFLDFPRKLLKGKPLVVQATASDAESGIVDAAFFLIAPKDGKLPPEAVAVKGTQTAPGSPNWMADLPVPPEKKTIDVTVRFTNGAGLSEIKSQKVELVDPPPPSGTVKGKVVENDRPQAGLKVALMDEKGTMAVDAKKTNDKGEFVFENVKPGAYKVMCAKAEDKTDGDEVIAVEVDKTTLVTLFLTRKPAKKK